MILQAIATQSTALFSKAEKDDAAERIVQIHVDFLKECWMNDLCMRCLSIIGNT